MARGENRGQSLPPDLLEQLQASLPPEGQQLLQELLNGAPPDQVMMRVAAAAGLSRAEVEQLLAQPEAVKKLADQVLAGGAVDPAQLRALLNSPDASGSE